MGDQLVDRLNAIANMEYIQEYSPNRLCVLTAINDVLNWMKSTGRQPGSNKWYTTHLSETKRYVETRLYELCGHRLYELDPPISDCELAKLFDDCRKRGFKMLRDALPIQSEPQRPLFDTHEPASVVYAYHGTIATNSSRLIKIGYTAQPIVDYLAGKRLQHSPVLLATMCGDAKTEQAFHRKWRHLLVDGREWFSVDAGMLRWIRNTMVIVEGFDAEVKSLLQQDGMLFAAESAVELSPDPE